MRSTARDSPEQRRTLAILTVAQILSGAGLAAGITIGPLLAEDMFETASLAGIPTALFIIGSAGAALLVGGVSQRFGRRPGLAMGYGAGAIGSLGVVAATVADNVPLLFLSLLIYGAGTATNLQARYAGADLASPARRGRAVSTVLVATTLGAVVGPNLVEPMGRLATGWGIPALAGPFILAAGAYGGAAAVLWIFLRPDPLLLAQRLSAAEAPLSAAQNGRLAPGSGAHSLTIGATVMVLTQIVMVAIMTMTPIHMNHHGHGVSATGLVIAVHVGAMYLPSPVTGRLVDRFGRLPVAAAAGIVLLAAGLVAAFAPTDSVLVLATALGLLGLGWNLGLISGTAIVTDAIPLATRARTQGTVDLCIALAGAGGGLASGVIVASSSYAVLAIAGGIIALAIVPAVTMVARSATAPRPHSTL